MASKVFGLKHQFGDEVPWDYSSIQSLDEFREIVSDATVIGLVDTNGLGGDIVFGREVLRAIGAEVIPPQQIVLVLFAIDSNTDQLEHLIAAVQVVKGYSEFD